MKIMYIFKIIAVFATLLWSSKFSVGQSSNFIVIDGIKLKMEYFFTDDCSKPYLLYYFKSAKDITNDIKTKLQENLFISEANNQKSLPIDVLKFEENNDVERNEFGDEFVVSCYKCGNDVTQTNDKGYCKNCK